MNPYIIPVGFLNCLVSFFLLLATDRITGRGASLIRICFAALWSGIYGGICAVSGVFGNTLIRLLSMVITTVIAWLGYGKVLYAGILYGILQLALTGLAAGLNTWLGAIFLAIAVCVLWLVGMQKNTADMIPVEIGLPEQKLRINALRDTGNTLQDPVTGQPVLVVGADIAQKLCGLSRMQLRNPVSAIRECPGLLLIPYRTVSDPGNMLLAKKMKHVRIGKWQGSMLIAFAPECLDPTGTFQALVGGKV